MISLAPLLLFLYHFSAADDGKGAAMCSIIGYCFAGGTYEEIKEALEQTRSRGPDDSRIISAGNGWLGFNRLSIMGLTEEGMQPFISRDHHTVRYADYIKENTGSSEKEPGTDQGKSSACVCDDIILVCNGEIYGFRPLKEDLEAKGFQFISDSDCEILPALYRLYGTSMFSMLDAEFAMILYDGANKSWIAARDPIGIRPLYYGVRPDGTYVFASEPKSLVSLVDKVFPFPPGHYFRDGVFTSYRDMASVKEYRTDDLETVAKRIHDLLIDGVNKRLDSDTPVGFLLSGGLDSSLVCGIAARMSEKPLETWAIGMDVDAIDHACCEFSTHFK